MMRYLNIFCESIIACSIIISIAVLMVLLFASCSQKQFSELEDISKDVLKAKKGIEIIVEPLEENK